MTPIPVPVLRRIVQLYERGKSTREIAQWIGFCVAAVRRVRQQFHQRGTLLTGERKRRLGSCSPNWAREWTGAFALPR